MDDAALPRSPARWRMALPASQAAAVAAGGAVGATLRALLSERFANDGGFPWATLAENLSGAFLLGLLATVLLTRARPLPHIRSLLGTGVLGAYTTFSGFALETVMMGRGVTAVVYVFASITGGLLAAVLGVAAANATARVGSGHRRSS